MVLPGKAVEQKGIFFNIAVAQLKELYLLIFRCLSRRANTRAVCSVLTG